MSQHPNHSLIDFFGMEADTCVFLKEGTAKAGKYDIDLLSHVEEAVKSGCGKLFIILHSYGSHFSYNERYGGDERIFTPDYPCEARYGNKEYLMNAYDNTIASTDRCLSRLIYILKNAEALSTMLYVSDHGEDLFDDNRRLFLHASPQPSHQCMPLCKRTATSR